MEDQAGPTIEQFREETYPALISKGVEPPEKDSSAEKRMFERWRRGSEKLRDGTRNIS